MHIILDALHAYYKYILKCRRCGLTYFVLPLSSTDGHLAQHNYVVAALAGFQRAYYIIHKTFNETIQLCAPISLKVGAQLSKGYGCQTLMLCVFAFISMEGNIQNMS